MVLRAFDVCLALLLLPVALVLGAVIALAVVLDSPGPVLYRSRRIGKGGRPFEMLKFRTMRHPPAGPMLTAHGDARQTPFGRFLASTRLDELPQLWNVVRGEMRLVGPRPEVEEFVRDQRASYERILAVPPGLTGPTQLAFAREAELLAAVADRERAYRSEILPLKVRSDLDYVASATLRGDLGILLRTLVVPFLRRGRRMRAAGPRAAWRRATATSAGAILLLGLFVAEAGGAPW